MSLPLDLDRLVEFHRQQLLSEANIQRLVMQVPRGRPSRIAGLLAGLLYDLAARLDGPALPSLIELGARTSRDIVKPSPEA